MKDATGRGAASEVTLWAVDYGVLSLTGYRTPDVLGSVYVRKALQVLNDDNRQRIYRRRVLTPKGDDRRRRRRRGCRRRHAAQGLPRAGVLARLGRRPTPTASASVDVKLPESLTTYRIMAVAADAASRFGSGDSRGPHQQAAHAEADVPALPGRRRQGVRSAPSSTAS